MLFKWSKIHFEEKAITIVFHSFSIIREVSSGIQFLWIINYSFPKLLANSHIDPALHAALT